MGKRRNQQGLFEALADSPWHVSVVFTIVVFICLKWAIPSYLSSNPHLKSIALGISQCAWFSLVFLIPGFFSFIKNSKDPHIPSVNGFRIEPTFSSKSSDSEGQLLKLTWSKELLRALEWKRFELLAAEYFRVLGKKVETIKKGADGGIDARIYKKQSSELEFAIQCKAWRTQVGVKEVRELFGVMAHESAGKGLFITTSTFSLEAIRFANDHSEKLFLIDGDQFYKLLLKLPETSREKLLKFATDGDYTTPTCASCGIKLIKRHSKTGYFWGCSNYPQCRVTMKIIS